MRRIKLKPSKETWWSDWRKDCATKLDELKQVAGPGKRFKISKIYKRASVKRDYYFSKLGPFQGKCAYCDAAITDHQRPDVEHYRPKQGVTDADDQPIMVDAGDGKVIEHPGYWWLAYSEKNLVPSCQICNQATVIDDQKVGKHNRFPLEAGGVHARVPEDDLEQERPLLLNPLRDSPRKHLDVCLEDGDQFGHLIPLTDQGETTVKMLALNLRDQLVDQRSAAIDQMKYLYSKYTQASGEQREKILERIRARLHGAKPHTLASIIAYKDCLPPLEVPED